MLRADRRYTWNNEEVAHCKVVDGWLCLPKGVRLKRGTPFAIESGSIADGVTFYDRVTVGAGALISTGASIGAHATLGPDVVISQGVSVGEGCKVGSRSTIGELSSLDTGATVGDNTGIGARVVVCSGSRIGDACDIGHDVAIGKQVVIRNRAVIGDGTVINGGVRIGSRVCIAPNSHIKSTPMSIQGPRQLATIVSPTEVQIGLLVLPFTDWFDAEKQEAAFKKLGIDGEFVQVYADILEFMEAHTIDYSHLSFGK